MLILLFGHNGQVGWELQRALAPLGRIVCLDYRSQDYCGDFTNPAGIARTVNLLRPNVIVNAAAYTNVDAAEQNHELASAINSVSVGVLAKEAAKNNALLVHFSTDYVFNGTGDCAWSETDRTDPINFYGLTKVNGEDEIRKNCTEYYIFRTSWAYSLHGENFAKKILRLAHKHESLSIIHDQYGAPTGADLVADCVAHVIRSYFNNKKTCGIYHLVASGITTWYDYSVLIFECAAKMGMKLKVEEVIPVAASDYNTVAKRPSNSRLSTNKIQDNFNLSLPSWEIGVERLLLELTELSQLKSSINNII